MVLYRALFRKELVGEHSAKKIIYFTLRNACKGRMKRKEKKYSKFKAMDLEVVL